LAEEVAAWHAQGLRLDEACALPGLFPDVMRENPTRAVYTKGVAAPY